MCHVLVCGNCDAVGTLQILSCWCSCCVIHGMHGSQVRVLRHARDCIVSDAYVGECLMCFGLCVGIPQWSIFAGSAALQLVAQCTKLLHGSLQHSVNVREQQ
jgi:hypothetical protein